MNKCTKCQSQNYVKAGFKNTVEGSIQRYKCKECNRQFTGNEKFHHLNEEKIGLIEKMYEEKGEQRKIARILGVHLRTVQHHLKKTS
jgi:transposase-like protein